MDGELMPCGEIVQDPNTHLHDCEECQEFFGTDDEDWGQDSPLS